MQLWKPPQIIRNKETGKPFLVVHVYRICTMVADLEDPSNPTEIKVLLERDYPSWAKEEDMNCKIDSGYIEPKLKWSFGSSLSHHSSLATG